LTKINPNERMKKLAYNKFGGVDVLEIIDAAMPSLKSKTVLVQVKAAAINPVDWKMREGHLKILSGRKFPQGLGLEFAGIVTQIGPDVTQFKVGDEVFGAAKDCMAEYVVAKESKMWKKPSAISFEQAATMPVVGACAVMAFDKYISAPRDKEILINGATGGIGMYATQIAVQRGAKVTAVVSAKGIDLVKKWGVNHVINYRETDIMTAGKKYDVVIELSDKLPFKAGKKLLKASGVYIASLPNPAEILGGLVGNLFSKQKYKLLGAVSSQQNLAILANDAQAGLLDIVCKAYPLSEYHAAYTETASGKYVGKVVFVM
jgi:NADPH:quinone reductase-like Zn-dependent oxidoreductase